MVAVTEARRSGAAARSILSEETGEVHWNAVIAGVVVAVATQILLTVLGVAVGAATFDVSEATSPAPWLADAWWAISAIAAAFAGGWTAGNVSAAVDADRFEGAFQGFMTWGLSLIAVSFLLVNSTGATGAASRLAGPLALQAATQHAAAVGALWAFAALVIGAGAALAGGFFGSGHVRRSLGRHRAQA